MIQEQDRALHETGRYPRHRSDDASLCPSILTTATPLCIFDDGSVITNALVRVSRQRKDPVCRSVNGEVDNDVWDVYLKETQAESEMARSFEVQQFERERVPLPRISSDAIEASLAIDDFDLDVPNRVSERMNRYTTAEC
jgi:hypothetical protein